LTFLVTFWLKKVTFWENPNQNWPWAVFYSREK
jgi:hypothetical protein